jgi:hypothetical protein
MKPISKLRFDAFVGYTRLPASALFIQELAWYEEGDAILFGFIALDTSDDDFSAMVLGRDAKGRFRGVDLVTSLSTEAEAAIWLRDRLSSLSSERPEAHYQGDERGRPVDFFAPIVVPEKRAPAFEQLRTEKNYSPALELLKVLMRYFEDPDGNFIQQFQSTGFDARIWEIYLYAVFTEMGYAIDRTHSTPDFHCRGLHGNFFVEATTLGIAPETPQLTKDNHDAYLDEYVPIRFSSALHEKVKKRYWTQSHVAGHPFVIAIQDFHALGAMAWTAESLPEYLYGLRQRVQDGKSISEPIVSHRWGNKEIASNFFSQPETENISAVIANPSGTIAKFKRMGFLTGFGDRNLKILRRGMAFQNAPFATPFSSDVTADSYTETWSEGLAVYHNPNAAIPLPPESLPLAGHFRSQNGWLESMLPDFFPLGSETLTLNPTARSNGQNPPETAVDAPTRGFR